MNKKILIIVILIIIVIIALGVFVFKTPKADDKGNNEITFNDIKGITELSPGIYEATDKPVNEVEAEYLNNV